MSDEIIDIRINDNNILTSVMRLEDKLIPIYNFYKLEHILYFLNILKKQLGDGNFKTIQKVLTNFDYSNINITEPKKPRIIKGNSKLSSKQFIQIDGKKYEDECFFDLLWQWSTSTGNLLTIKGYIYDYSKSNCYMKLLISEMDNKFKSTIKNSLNELIANITV